MPTPQSCVEGMVLVANPVRTKHAGLFSRVGTAWGFKQVKHITLRVPATQILTALLLQQRWWDRPFGTVHFRVKCRLIQQFATIQVNSISEINAAVQFALASSGHSEGCHHIRLLQPRLNAVQQNLHSGMPNGGKLGFTKFQFQLLFSSFCSQQPSCLAYIVLDDRSPVRL